jgi:hypothetical protein
MDLSVRLKG